MFRGAVQVLPPHSHNTSRTTYPNIIFRVLEDLMDSLGQSGPSLHIAHFPVLDSKYPSPLRAHPNSAIPILIERPYALTRKRFGHTILDELTLTNLT